MSTGFVMTVLFVVSVAAGVAIGEWFFHLFLQAVPPVALSNFNTQSSRIAHWLYGGGVGVVLFVWAFIGTMVGRMQQMAKSPKT
jgi:uncharacterized membrane protein